MRIMGAMGVDYRSRSLSDERWPYGPTNVESDAPGHSAKGAESIDTPVRFRPQSLWFFFILTEF